MKVNLFKIYIPLAIIALLNSSCEKNDPDQWLKDNVRIAGKFPVIASLMVKPPQTTTVASGADVQLDLRYWSDDPIDKINLYATVGAGARESVSSIPYKKAYSTVSKTDSVILSYQLPASLAAGTKIKVETEVVNSNTLSKISSVTLTVQ